MTTRSGPYKYPINPSYRNAKRTICEVLREINRLASAAGLSEIVARTEEAHDMAKRMDAKLTEYKANWDVEFWKPNDGK